MVVIQRRLGRLLPYKMVFFASEASLHRIAEKLRPYEMARFFYTSGRLDDSRLIKRERTFTVCNSLLKPPEEWWKRFAPYNRAEIRKAERLGERVRIGRNEEAGITDFLTVYNDFARLKDGVWQISATLIKRYERFADRLVLYLDEQPMVVNLVLRDPESGRVRGLYNASRRLDEPKKARLVGNLNRLLHWHDMLHLRVQGFSTYDFGGWYAGAVGWLDAAGDGAFAVAIRSGVLARREAWLYAGAGIVEGSDASQEYADRNTYLAHPETAASDPVPWGGNHQGLYRCALRVDSVEKALNQVPNSVERMGDPVWCPLPGTKIDGLFIAFLRSPDGVVFEFVERPLKYFSR